VDCVDNSPFRFKPATQSKAELKFASDQTWLKPRVRGRNSLYRPAKLKELTSSKGGLSFVNETTDSPHASYDTACKRRRTDSSLGAVHQASESPHSESTHGHALPTPGESQSVPRSWTPVGIAPGTSHSGLGNFLEAAQLSGNHALQDSSPQTQHDPGNRPLDSENRYPSSLSLHSLPTPLLFPTTVRDRKTLSLQESCLIRHFVENLADPVRFTHLALPFKYSPAH
jgi:hypothetical protein